LTISTAGGRVEAAIIRPQYETGASVADIRTIDTHMHGRPGITAAYLVTGGEKTVLIETGPKSVVDHVFRGLEELGIEHLDWILVTHIHLDHAGAAGTLAARFGDATIGVHEVGAPHLVDPAKLWSSASRIYGDRMDQLWGGIDPIPADRIHVVADDEVIDLGGASLRAVETPGHAYHHHAFLLDDGSLFTGDALGVRLPDVGLIRPATPPPEFHLTKAIASIERIRGRGATTLLPTHFGPHTEGTDPKSVDALCDEAIDALNRWAGWVREARTQTTEVDDAAVIVKAKAIGDLEGRLPEEARARMENTTSYWMNTWGYMRYFDKNEA
jgi:glyoxylase-like metal-dependent hydrolase (beta-lactamase superfamily II)